MPKVACPCGARYQLPGEAMRRRVRCKRCGQIFVTAERIRPDSQGVQPPGDPPPPAPPADTDEWLQLAAGEVVETERTAEVPEAELVSAGTLRYVGDPVAAPAAGSSMLADAHKLLIAALAAFGLPLHIGNLMTLFLLWIFLLCRFFLIHAAIMGMVGVFIVTGWYMAYLLIVVEEAASNEEELPTLGLTNGLYDDVIVPFFKYVVAYLICLTPAIVALIYAWALGSSGDYRHIEDAARFFFGAGPATRIVQGAFAALIGGALLLGMTFFPIMLLVGAVGGVRAMFRADLMFRTILRTLPGYLIVLASNAIAAVSFFAADAMATELGGDNWLLWRLCFEGVILYLNVVAVRVIGLYYHHCKSRFAWRWE